MNEMHYFDPRVEYSVIERKLPHWAQAGVVSFITWRTRDSMPIEVLQRWRGERLFWLRKNGIDPFGVARREQLRQLPLAEQHEFFTIFSKKWHSELDAGHGACVLKSPLLARIVSDSLLKFDGDRYIVSDFVVMPNHVHLLAAFRDEGAMLEQCEGWKHFQAFKINREIGSKGRFWQQDGFDHLVRSEEQFEHFRRYIARNPRKAKLAEGESLVWSRQ